MGSLEKTKNSRGFALRCEDETWLVEIVFW